MVRFFFERDPATLTPTFATLRLVDADLPNLELCFGTLWELT